MTSLAELAKQCGARESVDAEDGAERITFTSDALTAFVERIRQEAAADTARLDWLDNDGCGHAFKIGNAWYTREAAGSPHHKARDIRAAIDAAIREASNG